MTVFVGQGMNWYLGMSIALIFVVLLILYFQCPRPESPPGVKR